MTIFLYVLLILTFLSSIGSIALMRQPSGPEGPYGAWILFVFPCLFAAIIFCIFAAKGMMNFLPGGRLVQFVAAVGIVIMFSVALFGSIDHNVSVPQILFLVLSFLVLAGCVVVIHPNVLLNNKVWNWLGIVLFGGAALVGWGVLCIALLLSVQKNFAESIKQAQEEEEWEVQLKQKQADEYAVLDADAPLFKLLQFTLSRNDQVRLSARNRVKSFPNLDEKLVESLDQNNEGAIDYIAKVYENPPAKLAPAWGRLLERKLKS